MTDTGIIPSLLETYGPRQSRQLDPRLLEQSIESSGPEAVAADLYEALCRLLVVEPMNLVVLGGGSVESLWRVDQVTPQFSSNVAAALAVAADPTVVDEVGVIGGEIGPLIENSAESGGPFATVLAQFMSWKGAAFIMAGFVRQEVSGARYEELLSAAQRAALDQSAKNQGHP